MIQIEKVGVLHLIDSLNPGGAESVAVNLANGLPRERFVPHLCSTRKGGGLEKHIHEDVGLICLNKKHFLDISALFRLVRYIRDNKIRLIHAHSSSIFFAALVRLLYPRVNIIWHYHFGITSMPLYRLYMYRLLSKSIAMEIAVSKKLKEWSISSLRVPSNKVMYLPNFIPDPGDILPLNNMPGKAGKRLLCIANLRPEKDHLTLLKAMKIIIMEEPEAHLILVGNETSAMGKDELFAIIDELQLSGHVTWLGRREDVPSLAKSADIGVLSSTSEGFPLVLLEYGAAGLAVVSTDVGECSDVINQGEAGILVPSGSSEYLAAGILQVMRDSNLRRALGKKLHEQVVFRFGFENGVMELCRLYDGVLGINNA